MRARRVQAQAWFVRLIAFLLAVTCSWAALGATPPGTDIANTASVSYDLGATTLTTSGAVTVTTAATTPATIQFVSYVPNGSAIAATRQVATTACAAAGGAYAALPAPVVPAVGSLASPGAYPLAPATAYGAADTAFVQVTDFSANADPAVAEPLLVTVSTASGDSEKLRVYETGPSTGIFIGFVPLHRGAVQTGNCRLEVANNEKLVATYVQSGTSAVSTSSALVDPLGLVFDSATGQPIDGVRVTLIDVGTNLPAQVFGDDGVSTYPNTMLTGSTVTDSGGRVYAMAPGRYQFPRVNAPGTYRLQVDPPLGYRYPSAVADPVLQLLPTAPYNLSAVSRGAPFTVLPGPPVEIDVPLDPGPYGAIDLAKSSPKTVAAVGDFVPYTVTISTSSDRALPGLQLLDRLPAGLRYRAGSARLNGVAIPDPQAGPDGRSLVFTVGTVPARGSLTLTYVAVVGPNAPLGPAQNTIQAIGRIASNTAGATIVIREELNASRAILMGQVTVAPSCEADASDRASRRPVANARILLQDGTYVITDAEGQWHIENVRPGTHVVQLDTTTLPEGLQLKSCEDNNRTGGRDFSQFVNVRGGSLWRADFRFAPVASCLRQALRRDGRDVELLLSAPVGQQSLSATLLLPRGARVEPGSVRLDGQPAAGVQVEDGFVVVRTQALPARWQRRLTLRLAEDTPGEIKASVRTRGASGADTALAPLSLAPGAAQVDQCGALPAADLGAMKAASAAQAATPQVSGAIAAISTQADGTAYAEQLPYDDRWLAAADPSPEWLHPRADFSPAFPAIKVAVKHAGRQSVELRVNGALVDPLRFDGTRLNPAGTVALSLWRGVEIRSGRNLLEVTVRDGEGKVAFEERREIHFGTVVSRAEFDASKSRTVADGRTSPVIAVQFLDPEGKPVRRGLVGDFTVEPPYAPQDAADALQREPLGSPTGGARARFEIGENGVALVPLRPTSQSGEATLRFELGANKLLEVRAWLQADQREWVLVGFAEGTVGHKALSGNVQALREAGGDDSLFEQNRLAFYAKGMVKGEYLLTAAYDSAKERGTGLDPLLRQSIDPNQFYTLYGDATQAQYDAASIRKLYVKIEKQQFYALFGDLNTGLTVTELGRYSRTVNGIKSEYKGERASYTAFATRTAQAYLKDEIQGDGTSGLYRLRARDILPNTDKARIEVRDRFQPDRVLATRPLAPWLDYQIDYALGTIRLREPLASRDLDFNPQFLVVEYESDGRGVEAWTYGGRAALQVSPSTVVGVTGVHEGDPGRRGTLAAADATVRIDEHTRARFEVAGSRHEATGADESGTAYLAEVQHEAGTTQARAYVREQQVGFGLGQQSVLGRGQRRAGVEGRVQVSDSLQLQAEAGRAEDLSTSATRDVVEGRANWGVSEATKVQLGARVVRESDGLGGEGTAQQAIGGVAHQASERLTLRASTELSVGGRAPSSGLAAYPDRVLLGVDYRLTQDVTLTAQHEIAQAGDTRLSTSTVGLRTRLWDGAELRSSLGSQATADGDRLFASLGAIQRWHLNENWSVDGGLEQTRTLRGVQSADPLRIGQVPASGTVPATSPAASIPSGASSPSGLGLVATDFTAVTAGAGYRDDVWSGNARVEWRTSSIERRLNLLTGAQRKLDNGEAVAAGMLWSRTEGGTGEGRRLNARLSYVWRPAGSDWVVLDRLEYVQEASPSIAAQLFTRKLINNLNANYRPNAHTQVALQYGAKFVREMLGDFSASGYTDLLGVETRHDLTRDVDVGLHAGMLRVAAAHARSYHLGVSVGYRLATNTSVVVGWNAQGFWDADFSGAQYRAKGLYLTLRTKFDQDTFDLNAPAAGPVSLTTP
ncbi:DUF11 domain-containing protein [Ramlibacter sp. Leaf400]|uniref:DUF11 domain-containing protein n=1 Tax=Ramlibacter sp. Leaf400 TaxID=1736365 RepID=UPI0006FB5CC1|nr:DUF11 domain-containing protein [Ramlibacter sp. Leaf400]KQT14071.1 hypothetical protein ASG30_00340 [Ramlibacter sp. Leaf400]